MLKLEAEITDEQLAAIDHVAIEGGEAWCRHAFEHFVAKVITDKAAKYLPAYREALAAEGVNYKNAAQRDAEERTRREADAKAALAEREAALAAEQQTKIDALVASGLTVEQATILVGAVK